MHRRDSASTAAPVFVGVTLWVLAMSSVAFAAERELDDDAPPSSTREIETPIQQVFPAEPDRVPLLPGLKQRLGHLPPFFADTQLETRVRTYYLRKDRINDVLSEAWAYGGSLSYRSGWLADRLQVELEGFTSQRIDAPASRDGTLLLAPGQHGYSVLGIANAKLRSEGLVLTGFRQYLDLPYVNRNDSRMTPNTFEAITLENNEGELLFSTGYAWKVKRRTSDRFLSFTEAIGLDEDRGFAHAGALWEPNEDFRIGAIAGLVPDLFSGFYAELGVGLELWGGLEGRLDAQFTQQWEHGDDLLGDALDDTWSLGLRASASRAGAVFRLGVSITGSNAPIVSLYGTNPSYVDLMQRTFTGADEKALLASASYDFSGLGIEGLSVIANFVAGFDRSVFGRSRDAQELDVTLDYRFRQRRLKGLWLRIRGSWLNAESAEQDGTDFRVILRYDLPVI